MEALDISFYNSLTYVLKNDPVPLELNFTVLEVNFGEVCGCVCGCVGGGVWVGCVSVCVCVCYIHLHMYTILCVDD